MSESFPERPEEPLSSDCCNSGCTPCIRDVYENLLKQWEDECERIKSGQVVNTQGKGSVLFLTKYSAFKITSISEVSGDIRMYCFQAVCVKQEDIACKELVYQSVSGNLNLRPSQHLILQGREIIDGQECIFTRAYTPISDSTLSKTGCFQVVIKFYPEGKMSRYLQNLKVDDVTLWRGPYGGLTYQANSFKYILMLCAGTGVAPMYSLVQSIINNDDDDTVIKMCYCCKDVTSIILRKEIHALQCFWNFSADVYLAHNDNTEWKPLYGENLKTVRLNNDAIASELNGSKCENTLVLICGNPQFCTEMEQDVRLCGVKPEHIHTF